MTTSRREYRETVLGLLPQQGDWGESDYLWLTDRSRRLIEYADGEIEVLAMPTEAHQAILTLLTRALLQYLDPRGGVLRFAPLRLRLQERNYREPDILVLLDRDDPRRAPRYWLGADWVLEVVSPDDPARDLVTKRREYAAAGIPEYWIVNPLDVTVLTLRGGRYAEHGVFGAGAMATSPLLAGFAVAVDEVFAELD
jgi:Uma2 family endonuclease